MTAAGGQTSDVRRQMSAVRRQRHHEFFEIEHSVLIFHSTFNIQLSASVRDNYLHQARSADQIAAKGNLTTYVFSSVDQPRNRYCSPGFMRKRRRSTGQPRGRSSV